MTLTVATQAPGQPEIFASIQGEGRSAGKPVAFLRLSRCNLACIWCDTAYTWHFAGDDRPHESGVTYDRKANQVPLEEGEAAGLIAALGQNRLVITGGEPLLQAGPLAAMLDVLKSRMPTMAVEIETNGTIAPPAQFDRHVDQYNVSPKLAHSGNPAELARKPEMLAHWAQDKRACFKFVLEDRRDIGEVLNLVERYGIAPGRVFLMPEGITSEVLHYRMGWLAPLCLEHGFRLSDRLHIHLFGDSRGT